MRAIQYMVRHMSCTLCKAKFTLDIASYISLAFPGTDAEQIKQMQVQIHISRPCLYERGNDKNSKFSTFSEPGRPGQEKRGPEGKPLS
jgi:hypothetical protein